MRNAIQGNDLKFPARRHFEFYDVSALPLLLGSRGYFVCVKQLVNALTS